MDDVIEALRRWLVADQALATYVATHVTEGAHPDSDQIEGISERFRRMPTPTPSKPRVCSRPDRPLRGGQTLRPVV